MARYLIICHHSGEGTDYLEVESELTDECQQLDDFIEKVIHKQCQFENNEDFYEVYIDHVFRVDTNPIRDMGICTQIEVERSTGND